MSIYIKEFYEKAFKTDYSSEDMPKWLMKESLREKIIFSEFMLQLELGTIVDIGTGDGRVIKLAKDCIPESITDYYGIDIINKPKNFPEYAKYMKGFPSIIDDIKEVKNVTCLGVQVHIKKECLIPYFKIISEKMETGGKMIWQENRKDTLKGLRLKWSSPIKYNYYSFEEQISKIFPELIIINKKSTKISNIFLLEKFNA